MPAVDETPMAGEAAIDLCSRLATAKATAVSTGRRGDLLVIGCDSVLEIDGEAHGKPRDASQAVERWRAMRGRSGFLHTGHCVHDMRVRRAVSRVGSTLVRFAEPSDEEIDAYVATGEPLQVAGGFTIDGLGSAFVTGIDGDHHNVVGISVPLLRQMFAEMGVGWVTLWSSPVSGWAP